MSGGRHPSTWLNIRVRVADILAMGLIELLCLPTTLRRRWGK